MRGSGRDGGELSPLCSLTGNGWVGEETPRERGFLDGRRRVERVPAAALSEALTIGTAAIGTTILSYTTRDAYWPGSLFLLGGVGKGRRRGRKFYSQDKH